ncbi:MAG: MaoC family dehydratase N-terminal domain-containing protein [Spirochaetes bacterium]|nr:MaoC family dehydratase N-terminal domain-containing protein [Spirochaetota bacterium]
MLDQSLTGKSYPPFSYTIERCKVKELLLAEKNPDPLFHDISYAKKQGYDDTPVPLTFLSIVDIWGSEELAWQVLTEVGFDLKKMLDLKKEFQYFDVIYPDDSLKVVMTIESTHVSSLIEKAVFRSEYFRGDKLVAQAWLTVGMIKK